jgi:DNA-binding transcriptional regulator YiaG
MPNLANAFKQEITRLARKEVRSELESLRKNASLTRAESASLKKRVLALEQEVRRLTRGTTREAPTSEAELQQHHRFRADGLRSHRQRLELSAKDYGLLIGASALSVYKWESGQSQPRAKALASLVAVRRIGRREATARLNALRGAG